MAMAVEPYTERVFRESIPPDPIALCLARNKLVDQQCSLCKSFRGADEVLRNKIGYFVAKTEDRRRFDSHQRRLCGNHICQQLNVSGGELLSVTQKPF